MGRTYWLVGDSTSLSISEQLTFWASLRERGDVIIPVATVPGYALAAEGAYFETRLRSASAPAARLAPFAPGFALFGVQLPTQLGDPAAVVVLLGTNDIRPDADSGDYELVDTDAELDAAIARVLDAMPPVPVLWVETTAPVIDAGRRARFAAALERARERYPRLELLEPPPTVYGPADVHFSEPQGTLDVSLEIVGQLDAIAAAAVQP